MWLSSACILMYMRCLHLVCIACMPAFPGLYAPFLRPITHSWGVAFVALSVQCMTVVPRILEVSCTPYVILPSVRRVG
jgi:hypothetical protein